MKEYNPKEIEARWQKEWEDEDVYRANDDSEKEKFYGLIEFPYPSGEGLHVGHPRSYTAMDVICRKKRMEGRNVLFPIGFDAFGLPAENYAMKTGTHPAETTKKNIANFTRQLKMLGYSFDWSRAFNTTDPQYYRWTQWIFLQLFEHGLAYKAEFPTNWCTSCMVTLANEEVVNGRCERCGKEVVQKNKNQWLLRITSYAQKLLDGLDTVDYLSVIKEQQRNWIGRSEGAQIHFALEGRDETIKVFTTRPDTIFGATYMVLSPEHALVDTIMTEAQRDVVVTYKNEASKKSDLERTALEKHKTGVFTGAYAINPSNQHKIPIWIADYVLATYGTGAIMAVPAHDIRDWEFATKYELPIIEVVSGGDTMKEAYVGEGVAVNSDFLNGLSSADAKQKVIQWLEEEHLGSASISYKL
ncbi:MAG TPA: leucine--tRNA ligase, partial [Patescibacteria group bacterium]|nr:leucine--tRNA ligase [Patescibacteria group bacterium]